MSSYDFADIMIFRFRFRPEMIPKMDRNDPQCGPKMIPPENERWHGAAWSYYYCLFTYFID